jgi:hypothetical protein
MTAVDLLDDPEVFEVQGIPLHRMDEQKKWMEKHRLRGVIWVTSSAVFLRIGVSHKVIPNTTRRDILAGDYGGVFLDDGYWLCCNASRHPGRV